MKISKSALIISDSNYLNKFIMNLKTSPFSILNKDRREIEYIKRVYKRRIQAEIDSYNDSEELDKRDTVKIQNVLILDNNYI